ncbi:MAG: hypothetical protein M3R38_16725 [Actinomycetota bacterium]|nr:hypothetical protein [Actinomycetota bacterium]
MKFDPAEAERLAQNICALLDEVGGAEEIRELEVAEFRARLDEDTGGAERALSRIKDLALVHSTASCLLDVFSSALRLQNPALARAAFSGVQALAQAKLAADAEEEGEEG